MRLVIEAKTLELEADQKKKKDLGTGSFEGGHLFANLDLCWLRGLNNSSFVNRKRLAAWKTQYISKGGRTSRIHNTKRTLKRSPTLR